ncbi:MAG: hypothetical protein GY829_03350 [Gammaproteobacteria bacterium]|nr:hypothetical protein [Gammaproteobacteria bacterium]
MNDKPSLQALGDQLEQPPYNQAPKAPVLYIKPQNTLVDNGAIVTLPAGEEEVEIGATIGLLAAKTMSRVSLVSALLDIAGGVLVADLSLPHDSYYRPAIREKCFDGACPVSNQVIPLVDLSVEDLELTISINGAEVATKRLNQQVRSAAQLLVDVTEFMTLRPGDMLLIGVTYKAPKAKVGDQVSISINGLSEVSFTLSQSGGGQ